LRQQQGAKGVEETITEDTPMLIRIPVKGMPLQQLMQERLVQKGHNANSQQHSRSQGRSQSRLPARLLIND
jgi:hypothetical protein